METANAKGRLLDLFGQHAVKFDVLAEGGQFRATAQVGQLEPLSGCLSSNKLAAQQSAAEVALRHVLSHPELVPQESPHDFKGQLARLQQPSGNIASYKTLLSENGGFISTLALGNRTVQSQQLGRKKVDAEQFAAKAFLETLDSNDRANANGSAVRTAYPAGTMAEQSEHPLLPDQLPTEAVDKELQMEAVRQQFEEHAKLKLLLQSNPAYEQIRGNFAQCIKTAFQDGLIGEEEKKHLQAINGRGNCAKHCPEKLQPKEPPQEQFASSVSAENVEILTSLDEMD
ncbi:unnamed protein product [Symbiodinium pilosum]|uniref:DRBM domain-containing protein n=1 Tax=Symbiodinium pilosum TaxID=2952 RepID=A0A812W4X1_SYMPI|nr:unnamed protein product [Symbiodinium pilosum]